MLVVSDTSPFTALLTIGQIDWLPELFEEVVVPAAVRDELSMAHANLPTWLQVDLRTCAIPPEVVAANLDPGEAAAIALALDIRADGLLIDERKGRQVASLLGLRVTGLLGILLIAKEEGLIATVEPWVERLQVEAGCWFDANLIREVLRSVGELP